jgi:hypothetical protein
MKQKYAGENSNEREIGRWESENSLGYPLDQTIPEQNRTKQTSRSGAMSVSPGI